jgi:proline dehydrogenase
MSWFDRLVVGTLPIVPRSVVQSVASRYVAGATLDDALEHIRRLNGLGAMATVDLLGEEVTEPERADNNVAEYLRILDALAREKLDANISIKLTAFGLDISEDFCQQQLHRVLARAEALDNFVRIDMEDHTRTDATLRIYETARQEHRNVGAVLQAMLFRTEGDIELLDGEDFSARGGNARLCKGIYREPADIAYQSFDEVREAFVRCLDKLFSRRCYVGIATHDDYLVERTYELVAKHGLSPEQYEFQMLLGVTPNLRASVIERGHRLRVYVPYGEDWYAYSLRRLRENPTVARHVIRAFFKRG